MSLSTTLTSAKVSAEDKRKIKALVADGKSDRDAVKAIMAEAFRELDGLRDDLKELGINMDVQKIERKSL